MRSRGCVRTEELSQLLGVGLEGQVLDQQLRARLVAGLLALPLGRTLDLGRACLLAVRHLGGERGMGSVCVCVYVCMCVCVCVCVSKGVEGDKSTSMISML
jgi:hypothetical protein